MNEIKDSPVKGYTDQGEAKVALVNRYKEIEERLLREVDTIGIAELINHDPRWAAIARTHFQEGFMALNRAVFQPQRIKLPEDVEPQSVGLVD
jgi:hypothetical protein